MAEKDRVIQAARGPAMPELRHCPQCGAELPPDAPEGVCPKCVLGLGFGSSLGSPLKPEQIHSLETMPPSSEQAGEKEASKASEVCGGVGTAAYHAPFT